VATFAMGTALGDLAAVSLNLGYGYSLLIFGALIAVIAVGYRRMRWNPVVTFWSAYVVTRPVGASFADWVGKPHNVGGLGWGDGRVSLILATLIAVLVTFLALTRRDVQRRREER
jgi:uncharacterized membrane-anchored protein